MGRSNSRLRRLFPRPSTSTLLVRALRWVLVPLLAPLGYVVAVLTVILFTQLLRRTCPPEFVVSDACTAGWYPDAELGAIALATALGAAVWVVLPALAAPSRRGRVAWLAFACGVVFASWFTFQVGLGFAVPFGSALVAGAIAALLITSRFKRAT